MSFAIRPFAERWNQSWNIFVELEPKEPASGKSAI